MIVEQAKLQRLLILAVTSAARYKNTWASATLTHTRGSLRALRTEAAPSSIRPTVPQAPPRTSPHRDMIGGTRELLTTIVTVSSPDGSLLHGGKCRRVISLMRSRQNMFLRNPDAAKLVAGSVQQLDILSAD